MVIFYVPQHHYQETTGLFLLPVRVRLVNKSILTTNAGVFMASLVAVTTDARDHTTNRITKWKTHLSLLYVS